MDKRLGVALFVANTLVAANVAVIRKARRIRAEQAYDEFCEPFDTRNYKMRYNH